MVVEAGGRLMQADFRLVETSGAGLAERIRYIDTYCGRLVIEVAVLTEAVKTLAATRGADPEAVAKAVSDAVAARRASIELSVSTK